MGASPGTVKRDVLAQLSIKGRVGGRNPISTLCSLTGSNTVEGKKLVEMAVRDLELEGRVQTKRDSMGRITAILHKRPRENRDRTEMSAQAKREAMFAKGIPAYLPNSMCSPVEVRHVEPKQVAPEYVVGAPLIDNLNACLRMLRLEADEQGYAESKGVRKALLLMPGVTNSIAGRMMDYLQGMNLYVTAKTGFQTSSYTVDLTTTVTQEMLDEYKQSSQPPPVDSSTVQAIEGTDEVDETEVSPPPLQAPSVVGDVDPLIRLAEIVEELEAENNRLQGVITRQQESLVQLSDRCTQLNDDLVDAREQLAQAQPRQVDGKVADILARHRRN